MTIGEGEEVEREVVRYKRKKKRSAGVWRNSRPGWRARAMGAYPKLERSQRRSPARVKNGLSEHSCSLNEDEV